MTHTRLSLSVLIAVSLSLCVLPVSASRAQSNLTDSSITNHRTYTLTPIPGTDKSLLKVRRIECNPPERLLGKHRRVLETLTFSQPVRVLEPGGFKTEDHMPNRINFGVDNDGYIRAISCG